MNLLAELAEQPDNVASLVDVSRVSFIDVEKIVAELGIAVAEAQLETATIRGVAIAGEGFAPKIVVNLSSKYNDTKEGRRFTIAHELCHILHDRSRARRIAHVSGEWAAPQVEQRANAFAAYLLMPRELVASSIGTGNAGSPPVVNELAASLQVSATAQAEHLYNLRIIGDWERDNLRFLFRGQKQDLH